MFLPSFLCLTPSLSHSVLLKALGFRVQGLGFRGKKILYQEQEQNSNTEVIRGFVTGFVVGFVAGFVAAVLQRGRKIYNVHPSGWRTCYVGWTRVWALIVLGE